MKAVNLIPSEQRSEGGLATRSGGAAYFVLILVGGLAVLAGLYGSASHTAESRRSEVASIEAHTQEVQQQVSRLSPYTSFVQLREQRAQAVAQLVGSRFDWPAAMGELSRVLPSDVALTSVNGAIGSTAGTSSASSAAKAGAGSSAAGGSVSSATPPGAVPTFTIAGCATNQSVVAQTLVRLHLIAGVKAVELQSSTKPGGGSGGASGASAGAGGCSTGDPVFSAQIVFDPLPSAPALVETPATPKTDASTETGTGTGASAATSASASSSSSSTGAAR